MRDEDIELAEELEELERQLDDVFQDEPAHKGRFLNAIAEYLKALPVGALLSDIPAGDILKLYDRTAN
jgi:hypothetical protein